MTVLNLRSVATRGVVVAASAAAVALAACAGPSVTNHAADRAAGPYRVDIHRTADGVPHIRADDWGSLGYGYGYAQAQDAACTLADAFVTWRGERSAYFGPQNRPATEATFGRPRNLDADFFFRSVIDDAAVASYRAAQPPREQALIAGYADGYNRYISELKRGRFPGAHAACAAGEWVKPISASDVYRRFIAANLAGGTMPFLAQIATAQPPSGQPSGVQPPAAQRPVARSPAARSSSASPAPYRPDASIALRETGARAPSGVAPFAVGGHAGIGSNAMAFGADATQDGHSLLFGNPHWFWHGPDRFYQAHLTIPGQLDVAGAAFLGVPLVMIGFNQDIAWTHTVSSARRFGIFALSLVPGEPTHYRYDGQEEAMQAVRITVQARDPGTGALTPVTRTLYRSRFGPIVDLSPMSPALAWNGTQAFALSDVNAGNRAAFANFLDWDQARSLDDFIAIQKRDVAMPWVNTFAIGRNDARVWFGDIGAVPGVNDTTLAACTTPAGRMVDARLPGVPFLDGSRAACDWTAQTLPGAGAVGRLPVDAMPSLLRRDYVGNFNGSYWLTHPQTPLTGFPLVTGQTGTPQSLRTRLGHALAAELRGAPGGVGRAALEHTVLSSESMSARLYRQPLVDAVCRGDGASSVTVTQDPLDAAALPQPVTVDLAPACEVLRHWDGTANVAARGANLWDEFWIRAVRLPDLAHHAVAFDPAHPLTTPAGFDMTRPATGRALGVALAAAVLNMQRHGVALDTMRGDLLYVGHGADKVPLYGGCDQQGYFTVACAMHPLDRDGYSLNRDAHGNSYMQVVSFDADGPHADTLLSTGVADATAGQAGVATRAYARKAWSRFPFTARELSAMPNVTETVLTGPRGVVPSQ